jgi:ubiquinone/menaquinone biosynthesis C-methylase UbiE
MVHERRDHYLPAAGHAWLLPLYDPIDRLLGGNAARQRLVEQAELQAGQRVLDLGCGTGNLALLIKRRHPAVEVTGVDPDPAALARAGRKASRAGIVLQLDQGLGKALPYRDGEFHRVLSSFVLHHLPGDDKNATLREVRRVLASDGVLHLLDFGGPEPAREGFVARHLHASHRLRDNFGEGIPALLRRAGFGDPRLVGQGRLLLGRIAYYRAAARG